MRSLVTVHGLLAVLVLPACGNAAGWESARDEYCTRVERSMAYVDEPLTRAADLMDARVEYFEAGDAIDSGKPLDRETAYAMVSASASTCASVGELVGQAEGYSRGLHQLAYPVAEVIPSKHGWSAADTPSPVDVPSLDCGVDNPARAAEGAKAYAEQLRGAIDSYAEARASTVQKCKDAGWAG